MEKEIIFKETLTVCDYCGSYDDASSRNHVYKCAICAKDVCSGCGAKIEYHEWVGGNLTHQRKVFVCQIHIPISDIKLEVDNG